MSGRRSGLDESFRWLRRVAPRGEIRKSLVWLCFCLLGAIPVLMALELALVLMALAGFPLLDYLVPPAWLAFVADAF